MIRLALIFFVILTIGCTKEDTTILTNDYTFIEDEITFFRNEIIFKTAKYQKEKNKYEQNEINEKLYYRVLDYYYENKGLIDIIKEYPPERISFTYYDSLLKARNCGVLYENIVDKTKFFDTLYLHNVKFEYIKCFIKNSKYYDSIPKLKARIESYDK